MPGSSDLTQHGVGMGTPSYMPPEQFEDAASADARADVYALGCMLYRALVGRLPFPGASFQSVWVAQQRVLDGKAPAPRPSHIDASVPAALDAVCLRALALAPGARYPDAGAFVAALDHALAGAPEPLRGPEAFAATVQLDAGSGEASTGADVGSGVEVAQGDAGATTRPPPPPATPPPSLPAEQEQDALALAPEPTTSAGGPSWSAWLAAVLGVALVAGAAWVAAHRAPAPPAPPDGAVAPAVTTTVAVEPPPTPTPPTPPAPPAPTPPPPTAPPPAPTPPPAPVLPTPVVLSVTVREPAAGAFLPRGRVRVTGRVEARAGAGAVDDARPHVRSLRVADRPADVDAGGAFAVDVDLGAGEGPRVIVVEAKGAAGVARAQVDVVLDVTPPKVRVVSPRAPFGRVARTAAASARLEVAIEDGAPWAALHVESPRGRIEAGRVPPGQAARLDVPLGHGPERMTVVAVDAAGHEGRAEVLLERAPLAALVDVLLLPTLDAPLEVLAAGATLAATAGLRVRVTPLEPCHIHVLQLGPRDVMARRAGVLLRGAAVRADEPVVVPNGPREWLGVGRPGERREVLVVVSRTALPALEALPSDATAAREAVDELLAARRSVPRRAATSEPLHGALGGPLAAPASVTRVEVDDDVLVVRLPYQVR